ncbi:MAG: 4Fe-4S cluster-binding domain-containing protein, partial [Clostridia bacterium]|nr:4Fe-4S cluster-binding domain-containing protein [Clostridia bacterium]
MVKGKIHSLESMGLVDGPGIRAVVFFQGCSLRCRFCHNPESWNTEAGTEVDSVSLSKKLIKLKPYFDKSGGGVTASGGEPLLQKDFLIDLFKRLKEADIHTCLDTAGVGIGGYDEILSLTDLVLYDVKAIDAKLYKELCGRD